MRQTFLWHDYETFGVKPSLDGPAQFAAIRTDYDLNEIDEPAVYYCQPQKDRMPSPMACLITGITPQECSEKGLVENDFANRINELMSVPATISVGYNNIRFDDELTRFMFWRNLIDPYAREWQNQNSRWDLLEVGRCMYTLRPEGIEWPKKEDGSPSFKLEDLTRANGLMHESAHDALSDVRATIAWARLMRNCNERLFNYCLSMRDKNVVNKSMNTEHKTFLHISGSYGAEKNYTALLTPIGAHPNNKNAVICWDLMCDPAELANSTDPVELRERIYNKDLPKELRIGLRVIQANKSPIVIGNLKTMSPEQRAKAGIDFKLAQEHMSLIESARKPFNFWSTVFENPTYSDVDESLYGGFLSNRDRASLEQLRHQSPHKLEGLVLPRFMDNRLEEIVFRWKARNWPETLNEDEKKKWQTHVNERLTQEAPDRLTINQFRQSVQEHQATIQNSSDAKKEKKLEILNELMKWADTMEQSLPDRKPSKDKSNKTNRLI